MFAGGNSDNLMTAGNYNASSPTEPTVPSSVAVMADDVNDDDDDARVTSSVADAARPATTQRKTRKKRRSSGGKSDETGEAVTTEQNGKGFYVLGYCDHACLLVPSFVCLFVFWFVTFVQSIKPISQ